MTGTCRWLHERLDTLPMVRFPLAPANFPDDGIYFIYEEGESWGHGGTKPRIVRVGTSKDGNLRSRISEHFLLNESKMDFDASRPAPHDRSIFRKNMGRAILKRERDPYLSTWEVDFTTHANRDELSHRRDIAKEKAVEA